MSHHHIADAIGVEAWELLCAHFGGQDLRIPSATDSESKDWLELCDVIGTPAAGALLALYVGDVLSVPLGSKQQRERLMQHLFILRQQGASINELVKASRHERIHSKRTVMRMLASVRRKQQGGSL